MDLAKDSSPILGVLLKYARSLSFKQQPDYEQMRTIIQEGARDQEIDINDKYFDWNMKAVLLMKYPKIYLEIIRYFEKNNPEFQPNLCRRSVPSDYYKSLFTKEGELAFGLGADTLRELKEAARSFQFEYPGQLKELVQKEKSLISLYEMLKGPLHIPRDIFEVH